MLTILSLICAMAGQVRVDPPAEGKSPPTNFMAFAKREAASYTIRLDGSDPPLKLEPEPVLRWTSPVGGEVYGFDFVWTLKGRPEVIASFYKWYSPYTHRSDEFLSLSAKPAVAERDGEDFGLLGRLTL